MKHTGDEMAWHAEMVEAGRTYRAPSITTVPGETITVPRYSFWRDLLGFYREAVRATRIAR